MVRILKSVLRVAVFTACLLLSALIATSVSVGHPQWIWTRSGLSTIWECPKEWLHSGKFVDGNFCSISAVPNGQLTSWSERSPHCTASSDDTVNCKFTKPCNRICLTEAGRPCNGQLDTSDIANCTLALEKEVVVTLACRNVWVEAFCDANFKVGVASVFVIRAVLIGSVLISLLWVVTELTLRKADFSAERERDLGISRQSELLLNVKANFKRLIESLWQEEARFKRRYTETVNTIHTSFLDTISPLQSRDPRKRFQASAWLRRLDMYRELRSQKEFEFKSRGVFRSLSLHVLFVGTLVSSIVAVIAMFPKQLPRTSQSSPIWASSALSWFDWVILADVCLEFLLFFCACVFRSWPRSRPADKREMKGEFESVMDEDSERSAVSKDAEAGSVYTVSDTESNGRYLDEVCLLIACHESCLTEEKEFHFRKTLIAALETFSADQIFVCDNGSSLSPVDATWDVTRRIDPAINYVYIPEGNKTFAFYWVNKYWIPLLVEHNKSRAFKYALLIDDDVLLPSGLLLPQEFLLIHAEIKAVHFPLTAVLPKHESEADAGLFVQFQDLEYKMAAAHKYLQSGLGRVLACHGAVSLWERRALDEVLLKHDTVFHGEDLYAGLVLLRMRDQSRIISIPSVPVFTRAPDSCLGLFRQRVKSWDLTSHKKTFSFLVELVSPISFFHFYSIMLKPYFLLECLCILLDWVRIFILISLVFKNPFSLLLSFAVFISASYLQLALHQVVFLRRQSGLRSSFFCSLLFPIYKLVLSVLRIAALCQNVLVYSHDRKSLTIATREDEIHDIPPLPPHYLVDWFSVWSASLPSTGKAASTTFASLSTSVHGTARSVSVF